MNTINTLALLAFAAAFATITAGCGPLIGIHGNGVSASEARQLHAFDAVANDSVVDVYLQVAPAEDAVLVCDDNLLEHIETVVESGKLVIRDRDGSEHVDLHPLTDCSLQVSTPHLKRAVHKSSGGVHLTGELDELEALLLNGSGALTATSIAVDTLELTANSSGETTLRGRVGELTVKHNGSGSVWARELRADSVHISKSGSGKLEVYADDSVTSRNYGSGHVTIAGDPSDRDVRDVGSGSTRFE